MRDVNLDDVDPGIRRTVAWLREHGFETTDSGDGVSRRNVDSNPPPLWYPHVAMAVDPDRMVDEARRLAALLESRGVEFSRPLLTGECGNIGLVASFRPGDETAVIFLEGVDDARLFGEVR